MLSERRNGTGNYGIIQQRAGRAAGGRVERLRGTDPGLAAIRPLPTLPV